MKYVLFTGITGQLGTALMEPLIGKGVPAACIIRKDRNNYELDLGRFKVLKADIRDRKTLFKYAGEMKGAVDTLVHMASVGPGRPDDELHDTIFKGTMNLYEFAEDIGCRKFIFLSSILAVGGAMPGMSSITEDYEPREARLCYFGKMKLRAERELLARSGKGFTKVTVVRLGNVYGPPSKLSFVKFVADMLRRKNKMKMIYHRARHSVMWAPIYLHDVIDCLFLLIGKEDFNNEVYFLTGSERCTLEYLAGIISGLIGVPLGDMELNKREKLSYYAGKALDYARIILRVPSFPDYVYSNKKIERELGFKPKVTVSEGVPQTVKWALAKGIL